MASHSPQAAEGGGHLVGINLKNNAVIVFVLIKNGAIIEMCICFVNSNQPYEQFLGVSENHVINREEF